MKRILLSALMLGVSAHAALAYTPQVFNAATMTGQDFTAVPANTAPTGTGGINRAAFSNVWGTGFWFSGPTTGLWITSAAASGWQNSGLMQTDNSCAAGFGYGDFHWRGQIASGNQGPGENMIMWPADGDPAWPGIIKGSQDNHISEVDVSETNYARNDTAFATFHFYSTTAAYNNGQIMHLPITYPTGDMTAMHDYDEVWSAGSLVLKVDGVVQMSAPPTQVRADYAHGGCNYTLGAQMAMQATSYDVTPTVGLYLANMFWSATDGSAGGGTSTTVSQTTPSTGALVIVSDSYTVPAKLHISLTKSLGKAGTLTLAVDGKYLGTLLDNAPDGSLALGYSFATAPASGSHSFTVSIYGDTNAADVATGTFTVP